MAPFVVHRPVWRTAGLIALALAFVALGLWLAGLLGASPGAGDHPSGKLRLIAAVVGTSPVGAARIVGWTCVVFFGACALAGAKRLADHGPVMRIDARGIWWKDWSDATIPWDQVRDARVRQVQRHRFLTFDLADRARFPSSTLLGRLAGANRAFGYGDISLNVTGTDRSFDELLEAFATFSAGAGAR